MYNVYKNGKKYKTIINNNKKLENIIKHEQNKMKKIIL